MNRSVCCDTRGFVQTYRHLPGEMLLVSTPQCTDQFLGKTPSVQHPLMDKTQVLQPHPQELHPQPGPVPPLTPPRARTRSLLRFSPPGFFPWPRHSQFTPPQTFPARLLVLQNLKKTGNDSTSPRGSDPRNRKGHTGLCAARERGHVPRAEQ